MIKTKEKETFKKRSTHTKAHTKTTFGAQGFFTKENICFQKCAPTFQPEGQCNNFRAQVVIDVGNFAKTENGHEMGPQGTDSSLDPTFGNDFSRRIRFRPPRGPKTPRKKTNRGVSGPGMAGNGFSSKIHYQKWGRDSNPCPGDPFRGHFPFSQNLRRRLQLELESYSLGAEAQ